MKKQLITIGIAVLVAFPLLNNPPATFVNAGAVPNFENFFFGRPAVPVFTNFDRNTNPVQITGSPWRPQFLPYQGPYLPASIDPSGYMSSLLFGW